MGDIFGVGPLIIRGAEAVVEVLGIERNSSEHVAIAGCAGVVAGVVDPVGTAIKVARDCWKESL